MKLTCDRATLNRHIANAGRAVSSRSTMAVLECILFIADDAGFRLIGNDLELGIETKPIEADITERGSVALEAKMIADIVRRLPDDLVEISTDANNVTVIKSGRSEFKVIGQNPEEFPFLPEVERQAAFTVPAGDLTEMIRRTIFCVSSDESKPVMMGELIEMKDGETRVVAIDGFRIAVSSVASGHDASARLVVPSKAMAELSRVLAGGGDAAVVSAYYTYRHAMFDLEDCTLVTRLIDGDFMDYEQVFKNQYTSIVTARREELLECLDRASLISKDGKKNPVKLSLTDGLLTVTSNTQFGASYEEIPIELDGQTIEIAFNPRYLLEALRVMEDELVVMKFTSPLSPCVIKGRDSEQYQYLALPLRVR